MAMTTPDKLNNYNILQIELDYSQYE